MSGDGFASPACFLHELDPAWLGQLGLAETVALIDDVLTAGWPLPPDLCDALRGDRARLDAEARRSSFRAPPQDHDVRPVAARLRAVLSRVADDSLHARLVQARGFVPPEEERGAPAP